MYVQAGGMGGVVVTENSKGGKKIKEHSSSKAGHNKWKELRKTKTAKNIEKISCWQVV